MYCKVTANQAVGIRTKGDMGRHPDISMKTDGEKKFALQTGYTHLGGAIG